METNILGFPSLTGYTPLKAAQEGQILKYDFRGIGPIVVDKSGNGNLGRLRPVDNPPRRKIQSLFPLKVVMDFDGVDDYISLFSDIVLEDVSPWSIEFRVKQRSGTDRVMIIGDLTQYNRIYSRGHGSFWRVHFDDGSHIDLNYGGDWRGEYHRHLFAYDGEEIQFYLDEELQDTGTPSSAKLVINAVGRAYHKEDFNWNGPIDWVRIYNRAIKP